MSMTTKLVLALDLCSTSVLVVLDSSVGVTGTCFLSNSTLMQSK